MLPLRREQALRVSSQLANTKGAGITQRVSDPTSGSRQLRILRIWELYRKLQGDTALFFPFAHPKGLLSFIPLPSLTAPVPGNRLCPRSLPTLVLPWGLMAKEARFWKSLGQLKDWIQLHFLSAGCAPCPSSVLTLESTRQMRVDRDPARPWAKAAPFPHEMRSVSSPQVSNMFCVFSKKLCSDHVC